MIIKQINSEIAIKIDSGHSCSHYAKFDNVIIDNEIDYIKEYMIKFWNDNTKEINAWFTFTCIDGIKNSYYASTEDGVKYFLSFNNGEKEWNEFIQNENNEKFNFYNFITNRNKIVNCEESLNSIVDDIILYLNNNKFEPLIHNNAIIGAKISIHRNNIPTNIDRIKEIIKDRINGIETIEIEKTKNEIITSLYTTY
jgi:hypothetical protein